MSQGNLFLVSYAGVEVVAVVVAVVAVAAAAVGGGDWGAFLH